eukprot:9489857-Pyramimonas_sp.AAC.1
MTNLAKSTTRPTPTSVANSTALYAWRCKPDSKPSAAWKKKGGAAAKCGLPGFDLSKQFVVQQPEGRVRLRLAAGRNVRNHAAFPRQQWTSLQRLVVKIDPSKIPKLKGGRAKSKQMIGLLLQSMSRLREEFGAQLTISFEWPRCCDGWDPNKNAIAKQLMEQLQRVVDIGGCAFDLKTKNGIRIKKPWRIIADHSGFDDSLKRFCSGGAPTCRGPRKGREAQQELRDQARDGASRAAATSEPATCTRRSPCIDDEKSKKDGYSRRSRSGAIAHGRGGADTPARHHAAP